MQRSGIDPIIYQDLDPDLTPTRSRPIWILTVPQRRLGPEGVGGAAATDLVLPRDVGVAVNWPRDVSVDHDVAAQDLEVMVPEAVCKGDCECSMKMQGMDMR